MADVTKMDLVRITKNSKSYRIKNAVEACLNSCQMSAEIGRGRCDYYIGGHANDIKDDVMRKLQGMGFDVTMIDPSQIRVVWHQPTEDARAAQRRAERQAIRNIDDQPVRVAIQDLDYLDED